VGVEETKLWLLLDLLSSTRAQSVRLISRCSFERKGDDARAPLFAFQKLCMWPGLGLTSRKWNSEAMHVHPFRSTADKHALVYMYENSCRHCSISGYNVIQPRS